MQLSIFLMHTNSEPPNDVGYNHINLHPFTVEIVVINFTKQKFPCHSVTTLECGRER